MDKIIGLMSKDDWIYTGLLLFSFVASCYVRKIGNNILPSGALGFAMALFIIGPKIAYSLGICTIAVLIQLFADKKKTPLYVFLTTFTYLMFVRFAHYLLPVNEVASHTNVIQLIITLRIIGITFEENDAWVHKNDESPTKRYLTQIPTILEKFAYFYHFCGLFTGPYYTFQMLIDSQNPVLQAWDPTLEVKSRFQRLLWSVPIFVITNHYFPLDTLRSDAIWEVSFFTRLVYAALIFVVFKTRVYSAWAIAESICVILGIGIYPAASNPKIIVGPTDLKEFENLQNKEYIEMNSDAIVNLDIPKVEFSDGFRDGMKAWNRSVQTWLALYVHSRVKFMRVETTMLVSAIWHGTYAGYFMSFGVVAMCAILEDVIFKLVPVEPATGLRPQWFRTLYTHTIRCRGFEMLATGFLLKNASDVHHFWSSIYYWLPLLCIPFYIYSVKTATPKPKRSQKSE
ncbi:CBN-MBOA-7 protein [Caenorhabditis brenneri]|uniref:Lysophospholipid acyltransferase 7 n=1 Tax=Caenorhabditis brenneri TaxID=135651 RepID=G0MI96_CAEBE|nr:CBN-MBOA-7 protein [Caenorhabditis brenneri]